MEGIGERKVRFGANLKRLMNATLRHECTMLHEKYDGECANIASSSRNYLLFEPNTNFD